MPKATTIGEFIAAHAIAMTATPTGSNPSMDDTARMDHWDCIIRRGSQTMALVFSQGIGHRRWITTGPKAVPRDFRTLTPTKQYYEKESTDLHAARENCTEPTPPELSSVLDCLANDASSYDNSPDFESWASDLGLSTDSRKAEKCYRLVAEQAKKLRHLLGDEAYRDLLFNVERE